MASLVGSVILLSMLVFSASDSETRKVCGGDDESCAASWAPPSGEPEIPNEMFTAKIKRMADHPDDAEAQQAGCKMLRKSGALAKMGESIAAALRAMKHLSSSADVQRECAGMLHNAAADSAETRKIIVKKGGLKRLTSAMRVHVADARVQEACCGTLQNLAVDSESVREKIAGLKGLKLAVGSMKQHPESAKVQEECIGALSNVGAAVENKEEIVEVGGIQAVLSAMKKHRAHAAVQRVACGMLQNVGGGQEDIRQKISDHGGVEAVFRAMKKHKKNEGVHEEALLALQTLSTEHMAAIAAKGGIEAILASMAMHTASAVVQDAGALTLHNIAMRSAENRAKILSLGGEEVAERAARLRPQAGQQLLRTLRT